MERLLRLLGTLEFYNACDICTSVFFPMIVNHLHSIEILKDLLCWSTILGFSKNVFLLFFPVNMFQL